MKEDGGMGKGFPVAVHMKDSAQMTRCMAWVHLSFAMAMYEGEYANGKRCVKGTRKYANVYDGVWVR